MRATVILHSRTKTPIFGYTNMIWSEHTAIGTPGHKIRIRSTELTKEQALARIEALGLVEVHRTKHGEVYDTPDGKFKFMFPDGLSGLQEYRLIQNGF